MYRVVEDPDLYHFGYKWLVVDMNGNTISKYALKESADDEAFELNDRFLRESDAKKRLMEARREFLECPKIIRPETVLSDSMMSEIIEICQQARQRIKGGGG